MRKRKQRATNPEDTPDIRMIGPVISVDQEGTYGIDDEDPFDKLPWGTDQGRTRLKRDRERFIAITKTSTPEGKRNVIIVPHGTARARGMYPFPGRRMIVVSPKLDVHALNQKREEETKIYTTKTISEALALALSWKDCGHVFFTAGDAFWSEALNTGMCNCAFVTVVNIDSIKHSPFKGRALPATKMLSDETFIGMKRTITISVEDHWDEQEVELEFRNYEKV